MGDRFRHLWLRAAEYAPGLLAVVAGTAVLSAMVLVPAHMEREEVEWRRDVMAAQAGHLASLAERYHDFSRALAAGEPVLLERLAYSQLKMRPAGKSAVPLGDDAEPGGAEGYTSTGAAAAMRLDDPTDIHAWLSRPLPEVGRELAPHRPVRTRLARLATGRSRIGLVVAGGVLIFGGLLWSPTKSR
ncbi:MAG: hypothetical protein ACOC3G_09095 [Phycisphaeraceae bacterium]